MKLTFLLNQRIIKKVILLLLSVGLLVHVFDAKDYLRNSDLGKYLGLGRARVYEVGRRQVDIPEDEEQPKEVGKYRNYLTIRHNGRLGNIMFLHASLIGIAHANYMIPCMTSDTPLQLIFPLSIGICPAHTGSIDNWPKFTEHRFAAYDPRSARINVGENVELVGYFQSWKYFDLVKSQVRDEFVFHERFVYYSQQFLKDYAKRFYPGFSDTSSIIYVGIHVRRGDMLDRYNIERGYTVADLQYIDAAMTYFKGRYHHRKLLFVVCSDDMEWCENNIKSDLAPVAFSVFGDYLEQDMALLAATNHTIMTVGTYGWWAAWLAGGEVTYYRDYPIEGSSIDVNLEPTDHFYKNWRGLSGQSEQIDQ